MSLGCGENTGWADGFSDCLGPDEDMQAELDRDYPEEQSGIISKTVDNVVKPAINNVVKPCVKGAATTAYVTKKAIDSAKIIPATEVKNAILVAGASAGCVGGVVDNTLEKTTGVGLVNGVKEGISLLVKSNTDIMSHEREMELLEQFRREAEHARTQDKLNK